MNNTELLVFDEANPIPTKHDRILKYTILWPKSGDAVRENRILPEYQIESTFIEMYDFMRQTQKITDRKEDGAFIIPTTFKDEVLLPDGSIQRVAENVQDWYMLPVDVDGGMTIEQAREKWADYEYILYTSYNHRMTGVDKFRMLFPLSAPISDQDFTHRKKAVYKWLGDGVDKTCLYRSRGFYMPTYNAQNMNERVLEWHEGQRLNLHVFETEKPVEAVEYEQSEVTDQQRQELLDALRDTTIDSYSVWWQMVEGLKSNGFAVGDLVSLSVGNPNHEMESLPGLSAATCAQYWNRQRAGGPGLGKLIVIVRRSNPTFKLTRVRDAAERERAIAYYRKKNKNKSAKDKMNDLLNAFGLGD